MPAVFRKQQPLEKPNFANILPAFPIVLVFSLFYFWAKNTQQKLMVWNKINFP